MKTISISLYKRPAYSKQVLDALLKCYGIEDYSVIISIDYGFPSVFEVAKNFATQHKNTQIFLAPFPFGCQKNIFTALDIAFQNSDYNIHLEDDIVPSKDCLRFFEWGSSFGDDESVFSICGYHKTLPWQEKSEFLFKTEQNPWFFPWGWATWRNRWEEIKPQWDFAYVHGGWDVCMCKVIRKDRIQIYPTLARCQNIGAEDGLHVPNTRFHEVFQYNKFWAENFSDSLINNPNFEDP